MLYFKKKKKYTKNIYKRLCCILKVHDNFIFFFFLSPAARMWCLARMFPILIGDLIPQNDEHWENFLRLLKIEEIVFAPKATPQLAAYLGVLIEEYLEDYVNLNDRLPIPKQHYMVHYPNQIIKYVFLYWNCKHCTFCTTGG